MPGIRQSKFAATLKFVCFAIIPFLFLVHDNTAKAEALQLRVAAGLVEPFVMEEDGKLTGFAIDIWEEAAKRMGATTQYIVVDNLPDLFGALKDGKADVAVSALVYTVDRDKEFDFTFPIMEAGFGILVPDSPTSGLLSPLESVFGVLFSWMTVAWMGVGVLIMLVPAHIV